MQYRRLGRTNLKVSVIGFGAIALPRVSEDQAIETINRASELGVNFIDTARAYGDSEAKIGKAIKGKRERWILATKTLSRTPEGALKDLKASLKALQTEKIELYQLHAVNDEEIYEKVMSSGILDFLRKVQSDGVIDYIGISMHALPELMARAIRSGEFDTIQVVYNVINRGFEREDLFATETEIFPLAREYDVGVIVMKPLAGGVLVGPSSPELKFLLKDKVKTTATGALKFVVANEYVSTAIPGMKSVQEVEEDVQAGEVIEELTEEEKEAMFREAERLGKDFCRGCRYCQPCPQEINIPEILRLEGYHTRYGLRSWAKEQYTKLKVKADSCVDCGECEEKCPFKLPIREMLKKADEVLR